jgi:EAL domain-containing protein (putative c-di-GMP-specific phosphodiesterase class I)
MENNLRTALAENQFHLNFQPVVSATDRTVKSFEALLRWRHPVRGNVPPSAFIPLAEEVGLIVPIGEWVIREACKQAAKWPRHIKVAVNVSAAQFKSAALVPTIADAIASSRIASSRLIVEVTESVMIGDANQAIAILHVMRDQKIMIAMDDFGTGYASLGYLHRFPFDEIKIDRSFVSELGKRDDSVVIVRAIISLAKALGIATVAEGVESEDQFVCLRTEGCDEIQGYLISRPMPAEDVLTFLARMDGFVEGEGDGAPKPAPL